ncbi:oxidoreductase [Escherichia coli]|nr:oxidoreductase [Escherichia coli]
MGVKPGGNIALLACAGPMGIGAIDYPINGVLQPSRVVVCAIPYNPPAPGGQARRGGGGARQTD